jgi:hypothetical protein
MLVLAGCHQIGTWEDEPQNFQRIFHVAAPQDVVVVHSRFWRSAHWTYEFEYFIHIRQNADFQKRLFTENRLKQLESETDRQGATNYFGERPSWFLPKPLVEYEIWIYADEPRQNFRIFIDRNSGDLFLTDHQV